MPEFCTEIPPAIQCATVMAIKSIILLILPYGMRAMGHCGFPSGSHKHSQHPSAGWEQPSCTSGFVPDSCPVHLAISI